MLNVFEDKLFRIRERYSIKKMFLGYWIIKVKENLYNFLEYIKYKWRIIYFLF